MPRKKLKYFIFRYVLGLLPYSMFINFMRMLNAFRFGKQFYWLSESSFFSRINELKLIELQDEAVLLADKSKMRVRLLESHGLSSFVPLIGVFNEIKDLIAGQLKFPCVIKMNRGSGMNLVVHSREMLISKKTIDTLRFWISVDPYYYTRERHYSQMNPCFLVEEYLGTDVHDYKVFCFNGKPKFIQVDIDRFNGHKRVFYDLDWNIMDLGMLYPNPITEISAPVVLSQMIETATTIAKSFEFIRVDFYAQNDKLIIGECTFFPEGGMGLFDDMFQDERIGSMFKD